VTLALIGIGMSAMIFSVLAVDAAGSVTREFVRSGKIARPLGTVCDVIKKAGDSVFLCGIVEQEHGLAARFLGTIRKPTRR
jgi:hypothetical protein